MTTFKEILNSALCTTVGDLIKLGYAVNELDNDFSLMQHYFFSNDDLEGLLSDCDDFTEEVLDSIFENLFAGVTVEWEASHGGEGEGDDYHHVYKFTLDSTGEEEYIKFQGQWYSYNRAEYSGYYYVKPIERLVKFYE